MKFRRILYTSAIGQFGLYLYTGFIFEQTAMYMTDVAGLTVITVGILEVSRGLLKGIFSPIVGWIIDKANFKGGKYTPWLKFSPILFFISWGLFFATPFIFQGNKGAIAISIAVFYILGSLCQQLTTTTGMSFFPDITDDEEERSVASTARGFAKEAAKWAMGILYPILLVYFTTNMGSEMKSYLLVSTIFGVVMVACFFILAREVKIFIPADQKREDLELRKKASKIELLKQIVANKVLLLLFVITILVIGRNMLAGPLTPYYFKYVFGDMSKLSLYSAFARPFAVAGMLLAPLLVKLLGDTKRTLWLSALLAGIFQLAVFMTNSAKGFIAAASGIGFFMSVFTVVVVVMFANAVDYGEWKYGNRLSGSTMAIYGMAIQFAVMLMSWVRAQSLNAIGFVGGMDPTPEIANGIQNLYAGFGIVLIIGAILSATLPLGDDKMKQIKEELGKEAKIEVKSGI